MKSKLFSTDTIFFILVLVFSLLIWWPTRYFPFFWDSAGFVNNTAKSIYDSNFQNLIAVETDFAHPTMIMAIMAGLWKIFTTDRLVSHLLMFPFLPLVMISTYFLAKLYLPKHISYLASFITAFIPTMLAEYGIVYIDLPAAAFSLLGFTLYFYKKPLLASIFISLAVLCKLPLLVIIIPLFLFNRKQSKYLILPIAITISWLIYHYLQTNWWLVRPGRGTLIPQSLDRLIESTASVFDVFFIKQYRFLLTLPALVSGLYLIYKNKFVFHPLLSLLLTIVLSLIIFILMGEFAPRYALFIFPFLVILSLKLVSKLVHPYLTLVYSGLVLIFFFLSWHPKVSQTAAYDYRPPDDLSYQDMIMVFRQAAAYISLTNADAIIYGGFPENQHILEPHQGFIGYPLQFKYCQEFTPNDKDLQIVYLHAYSPSQIPCRQILDKYKMITLTRFESNGKWVELFLYDSPAVVKRYKLDRVSKP